MIKIILQSAKRGADNEVVCTIKRKRKEKVINVPDRDFIQVKYGLFVITNKPVFSRKVRT